MSKYCGIICWIRNNLDTKSDKLIYYSLIQRFLTYSINVWSSIYQTNLKTLSTEQKISVRSLFATTQQPHSTDIFTAQKCLPLARLIKLQEGILAYKVNSGQQLLRNFLTDGHVDRHYQLRNNADLRIPLHETTHMPFNFSGTEQLKRGITYQTTYVAHHPFIVLRQNSN